MLNDKKLKVSPRDIAVLSRKQVHGKDIAEGLTALGIPVNYVGKSNTYSSPSARTLFAYLRIVAEPSHSGIQITKILRDHGITEINISKINREANSRAYKKTDGDYVYDVLSDLASSDPHMSEITQKDQITELYKKIKSIIEFSNGNNLYCHHATREGGAHAGQAGSQGHECGRAGGFHGCGGYPRAAKTRVVRATSIDRGVVPPNRRLPRTNDFFGAVNGIEVGSNDRAALTCIVVLGLRHDQRPRWRHVSSLRLFHIDRRALGPRDAPAGRPGHGHVFFFGPLNGTPLSFLSLRASTDPRDLLPRIP